MFIAKVIGNVWADRKHRELAGAKLLLVKAMEPGGGGLVGESTLALDGGFGAGPGDAVLVVDEGGSARKILGNPKCPVRTVVCGVLDKVQVHGKTVLSR
ncbi:MAG TPA: EutN/CcmL family microcompartment protein [Elusimicrobiales bacterium]|nr:EutN/CcmL family microcompartment protein [Elusimicrobiales bacterium]